MCSVYLMVKILLPNTYNKWHYNCLKCHSLESIDKLRSLMLICTCFYKLIGTVSWVDIYGVLFHKQIWREWMQFLRKVLNFFWKYGFYKIIKVYVISFTNRQWFYIIALTGHLFWHKLMHIFILLQLLCYENEKCTSEEILQKTINRKYFVQNNSINIVQTF